MDINQLILLIEDKLRKNFLIQDIIIKDKTHLHKNHLSHTEGKFHLLINIKSEQLKELNRVEGTKKIYHILDNEIKLYIHSIQILIN